MTDTQRLKALIDGARERTRLLLSSELSLGSASLDLILEAQANEIRVAATEMAKTEALGLSSDAATTLWAMLGLAVAHGFVPDETRARMTRLVQDLVRGGR